MVVFQSAQASTPRTALIGRRAELEAVDRFVEDLRDGLASFHVIGDAGIGKTSVWAEAVRRAAAAGVRILRAAPAESERGLSLGGLTDLVAEVAPHEMGELPSIQRHALDIAVL